MSPQIATIFFISGILGLFMLNWDWKARTSKALWIPVVWLWIAGSRPVSVWWEGYWPQGSPDQYLEGSPLDRNVFIGLLALGVIVLVTRKRKVGTLLRANGAILLFLSYSAVSVTWSDYPEVAFKRWIKFLGDFVMILIVLTECDYLNAIKRVLARAGFVLLPLSVLLIKYYPSVGRGYGPWEGKQYFNGVGDNKNALGMISLILGLGSLWHFLQLYHRQMNSSKVKQLIAQGVLVTTSLWLMWVANSMTSLSCFFMAAGLMAATNLRTVERRPWVVHVLVAAILSVSLSVVFLDVGGDLLGTMGRDATLTGRTEIWSLVLGMKGNPVLGTGFESFWLGKRLEKIWSLYWWHPNEAHDGYIEIFLELGWIGVALFVIVLVTGYRKVIGAFRRDTGTGKLMLAYFVVAVAYDFTESAIKALNPVWITLLLAIMAAPNLSAPENPPPVATPISSLNLSNRLPT